MTLSFDISISISISLSISLNYFIQLYYLLLKLYRLMTLLKHRVYMTISIYIQSLSLIYLIHLPSSYVQFVPGSYNIMKEMNDPLFYISISISISLSISLNYFIQLHYLLLKLQRLMTL